jgi:hypothetical protein
MGMSDTLSALRRRGRPAGPEPLCTVAEVAEAFAVPVQTVYGWTRQTASDGLPVLPVRKLGRLVRVRVRDLDQLDERLCARPPVSFFVGGSAND